MTTEKKWISRLLIVMLAGYMTVTLSACGGGDAAFTGDVTTPDESPATPPTDGGSVSACTTDADCATGETCLNGTCGTPTQDPAVVACETDTDCTDGKVCHEGTCMTKAQEFIDVTSQPISETVGQPPTYHPGMFDVNKANLPHPF